MRRVLVLFGVMILGLSAGIAVAATMTGDDVVGAQERVLVPWAGVACLPTENVQSSHFDGIQLPPAETPEAAARLILEERAAQLASQTERAEINADGDRAIVAVNDEAGKAPVVSIGVVRYEEGWLVDSLSQCVASDVRPSE